MKYFINLLLISSILISCTQQEQYDVIIRNGTLYDGSGNTPITGDIAINADTIAALGNLGNAVANMELNANGLAVAPGFINMLSWANVSLIEDGRSMGDIKQGVTLEVLGEGNSMGPLTDSMKAEILERQTDIKYDIEWTTLGEYLNYLENKGISTNVTSFIGNATARKYVMGYESRPPTEEEMEQMKDLVRQAMEEGAVGVSSSLIYFPSGHADTQELIELAKAAGEYNGMYISHIRNENDSLLKAINELITISREAGIPAEIYHFKASEEENWEKLDEAIRLVEQAQGEGLKITADMYTYPASSTGLYIVLPDWALGGGIKELVKRLSDPELRERIKSEIDFFIPPEKILLVGFKNEDLRKHIGKTLAEVAEERGQPADEAVMDLIVEDDSRIQAVYFSMSEENIKKKVALPWMSFCSDAGSMATEGVFLKQSTHPRAYGSFARLLSKYVREENIITLEEAIRRLTSFPAGNLKINKRGKLEPGYYADIVVFDPDEIKDKATFDEPHQYAEGMVHVFVNGVQVLDEGEHTGQMPGRFVKGPGWNGDQ